MEFREIQVAPALAPHVECVWTLSSDREPPPPDAGLVTPDGCVELVFSLGSAVMLPNRAEPAGCSRPARTDAFVLGLTTRPSHVDYDGPVDLIGIRLRPAAAVQLFGPELATIRDAARVVDDLMPALARDLNRAVHSTDEGSVPTALARIVANAIGRSSIREHDRVGRAMTAILFTGGTRCLSELSRDLGISTRHLDRCFDRIVGMCPKLLCRIARFRTAWRMGLGLRRESWAMIAARCGYADQAHLCRDFREFSGLTPRQAAGFG